MKTLKAWAHRDPIVFIAVMLYTIAFIGLVLYFVDKEVSNYEFGSFAIWQGVLMFAGVATLVISPRLIRAAIKSIKKEFGDLNLHDLKKELKK